MQQSNCTRRRVIGLAGTTVVIGLAGCNGGGGGGGGDGDGGDGNETDDDTPTPDGEATQLRVVHASPNAGEVDVSVGGQEVLTGVSFRTVSDYMSVESGSSQVEIMPAGEDTAIFSGEVDISEGPNTAVALGEVSEGASDGTPSGNQTGNGTDDTPTDGTPTDGTPTDGESDTEFQVEVFEDDHELPDSEMSKVRLVHASPDLDAVSVSASMADGAETPTDSTPAGTPTETPTDGTPTDGTPSGGDGEELFSGVGYGEASDYEETDAGSYTLRFSEDGGSDGGGGNQTGNDTDGNDTDGTGDGGTSIGSVDVSFDGETVYSAFAMGYTDTTTAPVDEPLELELATDADPSTADQTPTETQGGNETGAATPTDTPGAGGNSS